MTSLRTKLFLSVGFILLIVALLSYLLPEILVRRDINKASRYLNERVEKIETQLLHISSFFVTYRIVQTAAQLQGISERIENKSSQMHENTSMWQLAAQIAGFSPQMAFVQITQDEKKSVVVAPQDGQLYYPHAAPFEKGMLWIKIPQKEQLFVAIPINDTSYLLFDEPALKTSSAIDSSLQDNLRFALANFKKSQHSTFNPFKQESSVDNLYQSLLNEEMHWVEKLNLIQQLALWQDKHLVPSGFLQKGACVLREEIFSTTPAIQDFSPREIPFLLLRKRDNSSDLDMVSQFLLQNGENKWVAIGFSISSIVSKIAQVLKRPVIVSKEGDFALGYTPQGKAFNPDLFQKDNFASYKIHIDKLTLSVLMPQEEAKSLSHFLTAVRDGLISKITLNLIATVLISFAVALFLLNKIAKRITHPIATLAFAAEELGDGKYEGLVLPPSEKRKDEVAVLAHSFAKMVVALKDREKIRGVLNKVVSKEIASEILKSKIDLGGEERIATMLFSDIRGFTSLSEHLQPQLLIGMLNDYMTRMCRIIDITHGVVDKFVGDEIMALYGAPLPLENQAEHSIQAALLMMQELRKWNETCKESGKPGFEIGIGIHTGVVYSGNMGAENRLNYTVIGKNVNLAARLCAKAGHMQILVSEATWKEKGVQDKFQFHPVEPLTLKGIDHPVTAYEVLSII